MEILLLRREPGRQDTISTEVNGVVVYQHSHLEVSGEQTLFSQTRSSEDVLYHKMKSNSYQLITTYRYPVVQVVDDTPLSSLLGPSGGGARSFRE